MRPHCRFRVAKGRNFTIEVTSGLGQCCFNSRIEVGHFRGLCPCFGVHFFCFSLFAVHSSINSNGYVVCT
jgi:hypothetical protein